MLKPYEPKYYGARCEVTVTPISFKFSVVARNTAQLQNIHWMRVLTDEDDRLVVFQPVSGMQKRPGLLKLGTSGKGHKTLTAKGLIAQNPWINAVARLRDLAARKFEMREYAGQLPPGPGEKPWFIRLMPAFEESAMPSQIGRLDPNVRGIYRYLSGDEVIYIGKGIVRDRYQQESERASWRISKVEYSIIQDDQEALEWEAWWIDRFRNENNGRLPRYNRVGGVQLHEVPGLARD